ncbi:thiamine pyrophosphate-dependent enzyme [Buttiauxella noackiae]|uniref:thiamine pyrophosphate-dependent enzyme n=1 Tax=Buttiauxella noackiae TaxID=82992 RepID=UPI00068F103A|nr:thiamine pyrophosphate-dependent enzyme [Buttiauxella noackiae]
MTSKGLQTGYQIIINTLTEWGITLYCGVTGGGVVHFLKHIPPYDPQSSDAPGFMSLGEYSAGFVPLGHFLSTGRMAAAVATTGAATKLLACGLSDAKLHDIPAVFIVPLSGLNTLGFSPLQDTSAHGSNVVAQLRNELPEGVFVLDDPSTLARQLLAAHHQLLNAKPVVLVLLHEALKTPVHLPAVRSYALPEYGKNDIQNFVTEFRDAVKGKRLVVLVGEEMARYADAKTLTTQLGTALHAATIWSINGANAVERNNAYGYGYISFGGNDEATALFNALGDEDVLLVLGACPDEYTVNLQPFNASHTFYLSHIADAYGQIEHSFHHLARGKYSHVFGQLDELVSTLISTAETDAFASIHAKPAPKNLNHRPFATPRDDYVDMAELYQHLDKIWPEEAIGFDDVCLAYKDRQYVTQRPSNQIDFFSLYRGSAMGGAFGLAIGAKIAAPESPVFVFTGDGCFRLFSGSLGEARNLGLIIFLLNNASFSIVSQGLPGIIPDTPESHYHAPVFPLDYCAIARACGWEAEKLAPDLSNLEALLNRSTRSDAPSLLIEVPADAMQILGHNPRANNL